MTTTVDTRTRTTPRRPLGRFILAALVALSAAAALGSRQVLAAAAAESASETKGVEARLAELEALVATLRAEIQVLRDSMAGAAPAGSPATLAEMQKRMDALAQEIERLRIGEAAAPAAGTTIAGFGPAAAKVYGIRRGVSIGGYGEMLYQNFDPRADDGTQSGETDTADLLRAVFYFGYKFSDHLLFNSEIEFEHAVAGDGAPGEAAVEFAYLDYRPRRAFGLRGGLLLVPMGFITELHEPPIFLGARRPEVERVILPSTWRENGFGVYGDAGPFSYRAYLIASLNASGFTPDEGIREGRQEGAESLARDTALVVRGDFTPVPGLLLGTSAFAGDTGQGDASIGGARLTLWDAHAEWRTHGVQVRGVCARGHLEDAGAVSLSIDPSGLTAIGSRSRGWYGEVAWNVLSLLGKGDRDLSPFVRYEALDTQASVATGFARDPVNDRTITTYGVTWKPIPNVAIKVDFQDAANRAGTAVDQWNLALGYLF
ncbi:MAG TPA: hypothetical protein VGV60_15500 [Candidatus Polarisedimenticolia bacterium]|nr:hypothetical protein [Candidatus Polarisedimenticolia bacterium]